MRPAWAKTAVLVAFVLAACSKTASPSAGNLSIVSPKDGATVSSPVQFVLSVNGVQIGPPETGKMHVHVHIDGSSQYAVVANTRASLPVPNGQHTLKVVLARPNHDETSTSASVTITVSGGGGSPSPSGYGY